MRLGWRLFQNQKHELYLYSLMASSQCGESSAQHRSDDESSMWFRWSVFLVRVHLKICALVFKFILYQFRTPIAIKSPWHQMLNVSSPAFQVNTVFGLCTQRAIERYGTEFWWCHHCAVFLRYTPFYIYKNVVFPAQAEYSYFSADFRLKIFLYYS